MKDLITPDYIFESSWEVCNKVGGIYTVLSTRAKTLQEQFRDKVFFIGPDIHAGNDNPLFAESDELFRTWRLKAQAEEGLKVRIGRWNVPGNPIAILVDFQDFYKDKNVVVIGNGKYAISETNDLINIAKHVTILTNGKEAPEFRAENVDINTEEIEEISGDKKVEEITLKNHKKIEADGIFIAQGVAGSAEFEKKLGIITKQDKIIVNEKMETNVKGIYACGDCTGGLFQVSKAVYEGTIAGLNAIRNC